MISDVTNRVSLRMWRIAGAVAAIAAETILYTRLGVVNSTTVAISYLLTILAIATGWGLVEAIIASLTGAFCFSLFLPPVGIFWVSEPENWLAFAAFLTTGIIASQLSASAKRQAREATQRRREMEKAVCVEPRASAAQCRRIVLDAIWRNKSMRSLASRVWQCSMGRQSRSTRQARKKSTHRKAASAPALPRALHIAIPRRALWFCPLVLGDLSSAASLSRPDRFRETAQHSIASLAAVALERARTQELANRADAARQSQELKSMLLDAISHEFKTPLTSIKVAISLLTDEGDPSGKELLTIVEEETDRLESLITEAIETARIEAGKLRLDRQRHSVADLLSSALQKMTLTLKEHGACLEIPKISPMSSSTGSCSDWRSGNSSAMRSSTPGPNHRSRFVRRRAMA